MTSKPNYSRSNCAASTPRARRPRWRLGASLVCCALFAVAAVGESRAGTSEMIFSSSFETLVPGSLLQGSQFPAPGSVLSADHQPSVGARFVSAGGGVAGYVLRINGVERPLQQDGDVLRWSAVEPLPEGTHSVVLSSPNGGSLDWSFITRTAPSIIEQYPSLMIVAPDARPTVGGSYSDIGSGVDTSTVTLLLDGVEVSASANLTDALIQFEPEAPLTSGSHQVVLRVGDRAGNVSERSWNFIVSSRPEITELAPDDVTIEAGATVITARFRDLLTELDPDGISLFFDDVDVSADVEVTMEGPHSGTLRYTPSQSLEPGRHRVELVVANRRAVIAQAYWGFWIDYPPIHRVQFLAPEEGAILTAPRVEVRVFPESNRALPQRVFINAIEALTRPDEEGRIYRYAEVDLIPGENTLEVRAEFGDGEVRTATRTVTYDVAPVVTIDAPLDWEILGPPTPAAAGPLPGGAINLTGAVQRPVTVRGHVDRPVVEVHVNQQQATLSADGLQFEFPNFFLHEGTNLVSVNARDARGRESTANVTVYVDQTAPLVTIEGPTADAVTSASTIDVRGLVNDAVEGGLNPPEPTVRVTNLANGEAVDAAVGDRYFIAGDIPLEVGANTLRVVASDAAGNARERMLEISRVFVGSDRLTEVSGDRQSALVNAELAQSLRVVALGADGAPLADLPVRFDVIRGSGHLALAQGASATVDGVNPARNLVVRTDGNGEAQVWLTLGSEAAVAGNAVRAWHEAMSEEVLFTATGQKGDPAWVMTNGASGSQFVQVNSTPVEPLSVVVMDADHNRLAGVPVVFEIDGENARFTPASAPGGQVAAGMRSIEVATDRNGLAAVRPMVGAEAGTVTLRAFSPRSDGTRVGEAGFQLIALERGEGPTRFVGTVMDHSGTPLAGVRLSIARTSLLATTDTDGRFEFLSQVPAGKIDLFVDGRDVRSTHGGMPIEYPALHFETAVIQGAINQLPHPIYLPPIEVGRAQVVGGDQDVVLTMPGFEGFEMRVRANSVTFPDGSRVGPLVISPVHNDRLPMVPPGPAGMFAAVGWTIQPTGTRFDPPIEVRIPNLTGERPGETMPIVQWDHDLATFVPMGRSTVSEDGTQIVSDPGSGITKAGWGGGGPPPPPPNCGANENDPYLNSALFRFYQVKRRFWGLLWEYDEDVPQERLSKFYPSKMTITANPFRCSAVNYEWDFGDDGPDSGNGTEVRHDYEERGEYEVEVRVICDYSSCPNTSGQEIWHPGNRSFLRQPVRVRDTDWIEYRAMQSECGWDLGCWAENQSQELMLDIEETLQDSPLDDIDWLEDIQQWNRDKLDDMSQQGGMSEGEVTTAAVAYAANEALFPTSPLDVLPIGRGVAAMKKARLLGARADELVEMAPQVARRGAPCPSPLVAEPEGPAKGDAQESEAQAKCVSFEVPHDMIRWKRAERQLVNDVSALRTGGGSQTLRVYQPTRGRNNGFDGAVVWRDSSGKLQLDILESKAWGVNSRNLQPNDLSAFGMRADPSTLQKNKDVLKQFIERNLPDGVSENSPELLELFNDLQNNRFTVVIGGLDTTRLNKAVVETAVKQRLGNVVEVMFPVIRV